MRARKLYRWALLLLPRPFRRRHGRDMELMFAQTWREARGGGRVRLTVRVVRDLLVTAAALRLRGAPGGRSVEEDREDPRSGTARIQGEETGAGRSRRASAAGAARTTTTRGRWTMGGDLGRELRHALAGLLRRPGFAALAAGTMALGIGASSTVFAVVDAAVFRALPWAEPDRLVALGTLFDDMGGTTFGLSDAEYLDYREEQRSFSELGAWALHDVTWLPDAGEPARLPAATVYPGLLALLEVEAVLGRIPQPGDVEPGAPPGVLVTREAWLRRFGGDPSVVGGTLELDGNRLPVLAVLEAGARLPDGAPDVWLVWRRDRSTIQDRSGHYLSGVGRLVPGATLASARAEIEAVHARWAERFRGVHSPGHPGHRIVAEPLDDVVVGPARRVAVILAAAAGALLLLACVNVAGLLVARGEGRLVELGVRTALGAGRGRLARQLLAEALVLAALAGAGGYALAAAGIDAVLAVDPGALPGLDRVRPDGRTLAFTLFAALGTGVAFGLLPLLRVPGDGAARLLRGGRSGRRSAGRVLSGLVVGQLAAATAVVVAAGLLLRSRAALTSVDPGFRSAGALVFDLEIGPDRYPDLAAIESFWSTLQDRLEASPGVAGAAVVRNLPLRSSPRREYVFPEAAVPGPDEPRPVLVQAAGAAWFEVMGVPLLEGRPIEIADGPQAPRVAVVNQAAARAYWPGGAVGERFRAAFARPGEPPYTIVGVAGDVRQSGLETRAEPEIYLPVGQIPPGTRGWGRRASVIVRTALAAPVELAPVVRRVVAELEPTVPVEALTTLDGVVRGATARMRFLSLLVAVFGAAALGVAAAGVYGTVSFTVAERRREMGVRLALGASPAGLLAGVLGKGLRLAAAGVALGTAAALGGAPLLGRVLFGVAPTDPVAFAAGPATLLLVVVAACWIPARRAGAVAPVESLRREG